MEWIYNVDWITIAEAAGTIALAVAAATPTDKDDGIVGRVVNIFRVLVPVLGRK